ncbi:N-acetyltransferase [Bacillus sp. TS-2]|nr:N-acetyltransferase [Bacillus sp. TS-2]
MLRIDRFDEENWNDIHSIYEEGLQTRNASFQLKAPIWEEWDKSHLTFCRFMIVHDLEVLGWAALSPVSNREVYKGVAEVSIYVALKHGGKGLGKKLLEHLVKESEKKGIWTLQANIFPENKASLHIHRFNGFRVVGRREKIAQLDGKWRDTILLERRSSRI